MRKVVLWEKIKIQALFFLVVLLFIVVIAMTGYILWDKLSDTKSQTNATNIEGGSGTKYNSPYVDKTYARIDGGTSSPGYFTAK